MERIKNLGWLSHTYPSLLFWVLPLLFLNNGQHSLIAHDEGYYAVQARFIWETNDWLTPQWFGTAIYDRTIGLQWLIALGYYVLGKNEFAARLPSLIASVISIILTYEIGKIILSPKLGWLGTIILSLMLLWHSESHLVNQNTLLVTCELTAIFSLLKSEGSSRDRLSWGILAGSMIGIGFLIKGFMIFLPIIALLPYLYFRWQNHQFLTNLGIYLGLILGIIPVCLWLGLSCLKYQSLFPITDLFYKLFYLSSTDDWNPSPFYYLWNLPVNIFPWGLFSVLGCIIIWRCSDRNFPDLKFCLLIGYPLLFFILLSSFKTRMPYYMLQIFPFMALLAGVGLDSIMGVYGRVKSRWENWVLTLVVAFSCLGFILLILGVLINVNPNILQAYLGLSITQDIKIYSIAGVSLGAVWTTIYIVWKYRDRLNYKIWLASWLLGSWLTFMTLGLLGTWTDKNPEFIKAMNQPAIANIINHHSMNFVVKDTQSNLPTNQLNQDIHQLTGDQHKTFVLLTFYTPKINHTLTDLQKLTPGKYAWVTPLIDIQTNPDYDIISQIDGWKLIKKIVPTN